MTPISIALEDGISARFADGAWTASDAETADLLNALTRAMLLAENPGSAEPDLEQWVVRHCLEVLPGRVENVDPLPLPPATAIL